VPSRSKTMVGADMEGSLSFSLVARPIYPLAIMPIFGYSC
jgi:hypothetical protein